MRKYEGKFVGKLAGEENQQEKQWELNWGNELKSVSTSHKREQKVKECRECNNGICDIVSPPFEVDVMKGNQVRQELRAWYVCRNCNERQRHPYTD
ncbi:hypothetical protein [Bacillus sp. XF8]|uniref:hypothetical protein n=1 Tax=Bacillus sp. XF8 TaxID=2819289 RepID=UPI001FB7CA36|nr:hypothetical protein [Bacillus sp. XF8]